ncbi:ficolin-1-A-like [Rhopilema esculentum]|uniref:ficolin-1-A-like n=1 Tax=Rhopilema esculentum TaxID=499914 RepID=UPI0031E152BA
MGSTVLNFLLIYAAFSSCCHDIVKATLSTAGHFFQQSQNEGVGNDNSDRMFLKRSFFDCERKDRCSQVVRSKEIVAHEGTLSNDKSYEMWKKIPRAEDCKDLYDTGKRDSGIYHITRPNKQVLEVYCDMETDGGGWTVIQRRIDGSTDFNRGWSDYKDGFGDVGKNMWMGLENMHSLASPNASTTLRIDLKHRLKGDELFFATYRSFQISDESDRYRIRVSGYSGTAGDAFNIENARKNNKMQFFTKDRDNNHNCAQQYKSGWWYNGCHNCQLNGLFPSTDTPHPTYMSWIPIDGDYGNINFSEMKIRRT